MICAKGLSLVQTTIFFLCPHRVEGTRDLFPVSVTKTLIPSLSPKGPTFKYSYLGD